jgi:Skp family chaperone for outer membrane proteins
VLRRLGRVAALLFCLVAAAPAPAQTPAPGPSGTIIVVVDLQRILREAAAVRALQQQVGAAREAFQAEIRQREEALRRLDQELARERPTLTPEVYAERRQALADQLAALQTDIQERRRKLDQAMNEGMRQVQSELLPVLQQLTEEHGADIMLAKTSIVLARPELEVTDEALVRLNARLPTVSVLPSN